MKILGKKRSGTLASVLSDLGLEAMSTRRRKLLIHLLAGSLALHVIGLVVFGGWVVMRSRNEEVATFTTPPPARRYEPRKLEHRVKVQEQQRSSSRPAMMPRVVSLKPADLALPDIKLDPKIVQTTFQPKFKAISGQGLGAGLGTGYGLRGFGSGVSSVNFFGIRARGERIAILVDVSVSMVEEERGGPANYIQVKRRVEDVIDALSEISLFNLVVFADAAKMFKPEMVVANSQHKQAAKHFLRPFNTEGNWGLTQGNVTPSRHGLKAGGGTTRLDLALTAAFEQVADTILVISDGIPRVQKVWSSEQWEQFRERQRRWTEENARRVEAWEEAHARYTSSGRTVEEQVWVPEVEEQDTGLKEGRQPRRARGGYWRTVTRRIGGARNPGPRPQPPKADPGWWTLADFTRHLNLVYEHTHAEQGKPQPVIHCIGYQIDKEGSAFLRALARHYKGQYRRVQRLR